MADISKYEPLWGAWKVGAVLGKGAFGKVYDVTREDFGEVYHSAVKFISVPQDESEIKFLTDELSGVENVSKYYKSLAEDFSNEIKMMRKMEGHGNIVDFKDHMIVLNPDGLGFDMLIRMELLESLSGYAAKKPLDESMVAKLGIDICKALEACSTHNIIHRDIKPDNIFVTRYGDFKLGDFGIARRLERTMSGLSKKGTPTYMAPEVYRGFEYGSNVDTYSLGIAMYRYLNKGRAPFLPDYPLAISPLDLERAFSRRIGGEPLPPLTNVNPVLGDIVLKAAAFERQDRFASPTAMREAIEDFKSGRHRFNSRKPRFEDTLPIDGASKFESEHFEEDNAEYAENSAGEFSFSEPPEESYYQPSPNNNLRTMVYILLTFIAILFLVTTNI